MPKAEAEQLGAEMEFGAKYGDTVTVYMINDQAGKLFSAEFCGGPHVFNTSELAANPDGAPKHFKIQKEEAVASGVRRIKAILE
jgi:alanyl-tRNA synthetase